MKKQSIKKILIESLIIVLACFMLININNKNKQNRIIASAKSSLEKLVESSELRTTKYTYNGIAKKCTGNCSKNDDYEYFVSYKGTITAGINFKKVKYDIDKKNKKLNILLPDASITSYNVDISTLDFIFKNKKYNNANELSDAYKTCLEDLKTKQNDYLVTNTAKENSKIVIKEFFNPWIKAYYDGYTVYVK